jgi:hypothetical protein
LIWSNLVGMIYMLYNTFHKIKQKKRINANLFILSFWGGVSNRIAIQFLEYHNIQLIYKTLLLH